MSRFDYVAYDQTRMDLQSSYRLLFEEVAAQVEGHLTDGRAKSLALTKLEEAYMWVGKALRDDQRQADVDG